MSKTDKHFYVFEPFRLDPDLRVLLKEGVPIPVQPKAFEVLLALVQNSRKLVLKEDLMKTVWPDSFVEESNLTQNIFVLRKLLGETAGEPRYIVTVPGRGYRFAAEVRLAAGEDEGDVAAGKDVAQPERKSVLPSRTRRLMLAIPVVVTAVVVGVALRPFSPLPPPKVLRIQQVTHTGRVVPYSRVITDGARLYFAERLGGTDALAEVPVAGGEPTLISTSIPSLQLDDIDPTRSKLLVGSQGPDSNNPLWVIPTSGGAGRRLGDVLAAEGPAWSSDGRNVLYARDEQVYRVGNDNADPQSLLRAPGRVISVRSSPDGSLLRFTAQDDVTGGTSLWEATSDGRNLVPVSVGWKTSAPQWGEGESYGDWTPDGKYFVFRAAREGVESFWAIREKGSPFRRSSKAPVQLYVTSDRIGEPRFSLDGKRIFFVSYQDRRELVRYDSAQGVFVPYLGGIPARLLSFSPDGKWVAYQNEIDGALWRSRLDGTEKLQLTSAPMVAYHSSWAADGKSILFGGSIPGTPGQLYAVPFDGGTPRPIMPGGAADSEPDFSPDGRYVLFLRRLINEGRVGQSQIYLLDLTTRQAKAIPGTQAFEGVHWSPDGKFAAASDEIHHRLMLYDIARESWSELSDGAPYGWGIRWSSDSQFVYYQHFDEGKEQPIYRVHIQDRKVERVTSARQILSSDVLTYTMTGLTPDNAPLATLVHSNSDIYALDLDLH